MVNLSESELIEAMGTYYDLVGDMLSLYLTITSGFLIVAYLVGIKLTRTQLVIVSGLYLAFAIVASYLAVGYGLRGLFYAEQLAILSPSTPLGATLVVPIIMGTVLLVGIFASLKFMWDVRHPKTE